VANEDRNIMTIRLPPDQMRRLDKAARQRRQTKQSFVQECTMTAVGEFEENARLQRLPPIGNAQENVSAVGIESSGLGIASALRKKPKEQNEPIAATPAPVVVQVGNTSAPATSGNGAPVGDLDRLALYVIKGDDFLRDARKRTMIEVLRSSASSDEEFNVLVAQLEQNIVIKNKTVEENSPVNKIARLAFDKLSTLLRGD
jgi:hypothetical protein